MEGLIVFLFLAAAVYVYANIRNAIAYTHVLIEHGAFRPETIGRWRDALFTRALLIAGGLMLLALKLAPASQARMSGADELILWFVSASVIFSQMFEQWALHACRRLLPTQQRDRR